jgi:hypothetical protein
MSRKGWTIETPARRMATTTIGWDASTRPFAASRGVSTAFSSVARSRVASIASISVSW